MKDCYEDVERLLVGECLFYVTKVDFLIVRKLNCAFDSFFHLFDGQYCLLDLRPTQ